MSLSLTFTSRLPEGYSPALEHLLFFNPSQDNAYSAIVDSIAIFGHPIVKITDGYIGVSVEKFAEVQSLFVLDAEELVGVMIYSRMDHEHIAVIQLAVNCEYSSQGKFADQYVVMRMIKTLCNSARRIKGVTAISLLHGNGKVQNIPV